MSKFGVAVEDSVEWVKENPKTIAYIVGGVVVGIVAFSVIKNITQGVDNIFSFKKTKRRDQFSAQNVNTSNVTITKDQADIYARQLWSAMQDAGTDEEAIETIIDNLQTGDDYKMVFNAFELNTYFLFARGDSLSKWLNISEDLDLNQWFKKELSPTSDKKLYDKIKNLSNKAGLSF